MSGSLFARSSVLIRGLAVGAGLLALAACGAPAATSPAPARAPSNAAPSASQPAAASSAAPAPVRMTTAYTTASASMAPVWLAKESGAFEDLGLLAEVTFIGAGQAILGALTSREAPIVVAGANQVVEANLQGGEYVVLGAAQSFLTNSIYVVPSIQRPEDLRGKSIGVSNFGAISHVALQVALEHFKLEEGRDVTVVRSGGTPETVAAMQSGAIHGGSFSPPQTFRARDLGFRELIDVSTLRYDMAGAAIVSTRSYVAEHPDVVERYLKALIRGVHVFKTNKDLAVDAIMRYGRLDDRALAEETWAYYLDKLNDDLAASPRGIENSLKLIADEKPEARNRRPEEFLDTSFVDRIKASGYIEQVKRGA